MKKIISIDAETDGLWGTPFAIAAIVYEKQPRHYMSGWSAIQYEWVEVDRILLRLPDSAVTEPWVIENVLPTLTTVAPTHDTYEDMLAEFASFYMANSGTILWHMGHVVESFLFREMVRLGCIGQWDAPYTPIDVSNYLRIAGEPADSVDEYAKKNDLIISNYGATHNPLYDCEVAAKVFFHLDTCKK